MNARKLDFMVVASAVALAVVFASAGCGKGGGSSAGQGSDKGVATAEKTTSPKGEPEAKPATETKEKIKLTINDFGVFGYKPLYTEYQQSHPNIEIVESVNEYNTHHSNLINHLAAGGGAASDLWARLDARRDACTGSKCPEFNKCFLTAIHQRAAQRPARLEAADEYRRLRFRQVVEQVVHDSSAGAHSGARHDQAWPTRLIQGARFIGGAAEARRPGHHAARPLR
jgi:hypothetical protein